MPNPKRDRQRQNRAGSRAARLEAARRAKKRRALIRTGILGALVVALIVVLALANSGGDGEDVATGDTTTTTTAPTTTTTVNPAVAAVECDEREPDAPDPQTYDEPPPMTIDEDTTYTARIDTSCGTIVAELAAGDAPVATNNFVFLAREGFYEGLEWHRVVPNFVIQGGDPEGTGGGGPGYDVVGEPPDGGYEIGDLAAAKTATDPAGTMGSQFFIITGTNGTQLPAEYARFGHVVEGLEVAQKLESFAEGDGPPSRDLYIFEITIEES